MMPRRVKRFLRFWVLVALFLPPAIVGPFVLVEGVPPWEAQATPGQPPFEVCPKYAAWAPELPPGATEPAAAVEIPPEPAAAVLGPLGPPGAADCPDDPLLAQAPPDAPEPPAPKPLAVRVMGPRDAVCGDMVRITAVVTGPPGTPIRWSIVHITVTEPRDGEYKIAATPILDYEPAEGTKGRTICFSNRNPGLYKISVAVADAGAIEIAEHNLELVSGEAVFDEQPPVEQPPQAQTPPNLTIPPTEQMPELAGELDATAIVEGFIAQVPSANRIGEATSVGGCFRITANRIQTNTFPEADDPLLDVAKQVQTNLGQKAPPWIAFVGKIGALRAALQQTGHMHDDLESQREFLSEIANVLAASK